MKVVIIHSCHLHRDFYNSILVPWLEYYSLAGLVSSSSGVVPPQLLIEIKLLIGP